MRHVSVSTTNFFGGRDLQYVQLFWGRDHFQKSCATGDGEDLCLARI